MAISDYCVIHRTEHTVSNSYRIVDSLSHKIMACYMTRRSAQRVAARMNEGTDKTMYIVVEIKPGE